MKQPMMEVTDKDGKYWGFKKVISLRWSTDKYAKSKIVSAMVDFMESGTDQTLFYNRGDNVFINTHDHLMGRLSWDTPVCEQELAKNSIDKYIEALSEVTGKDIIRYTQHGCDMGFQSLIDIETSIGEEFRLVMKQIEKGQEN